jgi:hypothetical protein
MNRTHLQVALNVIVSLAATLLCGFLWWATLDCARAGYRELFPSEAADLVAGGGLGLCAVLFAVLAVGSTFLTVSCWRGIAEIESPT